MRFEHVDPKPTFTVICCDCNRTLQSDTESIFANLDGEPFRAYYCRRCMVVVSREFKNIEATVTDLLFGEKS